MEIRISKLVPPQSSSTKELAPSQQMQRIQTKTQKLNCLMRTCCCCQKIWIYQPSGHPMRWKTVNYNLKFPTKGLCSKILKCSNKVLTLCNSTFRIYTVKFSFLSEPCNQNNKLKRLSNCILKQVSR